MQKDRNRRNTRENRLPAWLATGFLFFIFLITLICYAYGWNNYLRAQKVFKENGVEVEGKVISMRSHRTGGKSVGLSTHPTVEFFDDGTSHRFESKFDYPCREGDRVRVIYVSGSPNIATIKNAGEKVYNIPSFIVVMVMFLFATFLFLSALFYFPGPNKRVIEKTQSGRKNRRRDG